MLFLNIALLTLLFGDATAVFQNPSGTWRLNRMLSDDVPWEEVGFAAPPELLQPIESIVLSVTETSATFFSGDGAKRRYQLSGAKERSDFRGFDVYTRTHWNGSTLRLEVSPQPRLMVVESYTVDRSANQLFLAVTVVQNGRRTGPAIRYVYDSAFAR